MVIFHSDVCHWLAGLYCMQASTVAVSKRACNRCFTLYKTSSLHDLAAVANFMSTNVRREVGVEMSDIIFPCNVPRYNMVL